MVINKQDKVLYETEVCEYRRVKCHDCGQIQKDVQTLKRHLLEINENVETTNKKMRNNHDKMKEVVGKLQDQITKEVKDVKDSLSKVNKDVDEVKIMMTQLLEKLNTIEQHNKVLSPTAEILNTLREDIFVAGGFTDASKSTEIYSWEKNGWFTVSDMNEQYWCASSFIYNNQLFVVGGFYSKTIETLDLNELPLKWMKCPGELPYNCYGHQTVVFQQRIIHIGGYNGDQGELSDMISELQLTSRCTMKKLCQMPEPRYCHGADIFEDKVMILGGWDFGRR